MTFNQYGARENLDYWLEQVRGFSVAALIAGSHWVNGTLVWFNEDELCIDTGRRRIVINRTHLVSIAQAAPEDLT